MTKNTPPKITTYAVPADRSMKSRLQSKDEQASKGSLPRGTRFAFRSDGSCYPVIPSPFSGVGIGGSFGDDDDGEATLWGLGATNIPPVFARKSKAINLDPEPLKTGERGLVLMPPMRFDGDQVKMKSRIDRQELRLGLLLWDRIDSPTSNIILTNIGTDGQFLLAEGFVQRSHIEYSPGPDGIADALDAPLTAFRSLDAREPGQWSLARGDRSLSFAKPEAMPERGLLLSLYQAIPVPDGDTPLDDVLDFKAKRRSELIALRTHLEDVYRDIISSPDRDLAMSSELTKLDESIANLAKASKEASFSVRLSDIKAKIDWPTWLAGSSAFVKSSETGLGLTASVFAGVAAAATASLRLDVGMRSKAASSNPFEYVAHFSDELVWAK
ncbi:hypothetical protein C8J45_103301 [Sphingomonas sp. PP-CE-3G-477]|uniref:DUF6236 family protein n=1 Tax=Sphingomonas sp. PP-CE-3G-477 TaxID=2135660 RepID=UPI000D421B91|nr:DUF6236 family protein [Sphingomonas sp. PP-CE-3G-477]PTQ64452.1 hypothetical protein C8J45_103301 [Sphingomonas sp. PP-CE-3G-477]